MSFLGRLVLLIWLGGFTAAEASDRRFKEWWIEHYGQIIAEKSRLAASAHRVFDRLKPIAETPAERDPELLIIAGEEEALVLAIEDGTIVLTEDALQLCYKGRPVAQGDALLAFVLGHELSHLASDEFPYLDSYFARERGAQTRPPDRSHPLHPENQREREAFADDRGLVLMMMAGFDPKAVTSAGPGFFESWIRSKQKESALQSSAHPQPGQRTETVQIRLDKTAKQVEYFDLGVRYYQMGAYREAISLFKVFALQFPGRAVFNNLGLSHFQAAMEILAACDAQLVYRFRVPTLLDPETLAAEVKRGGAFESRCYEDKRFDEQVGQARRNFESALDSHPGYTPARLNLTSLLILANEAPGALLEADALVKENPLDPELQALQIVAWYQYGAQSNRTETVKEALQEIRKLAAPQRASPMIAYNHARLENEIEGRLKATDHWKRYLNLEPEGDFNRFARELAGVEPASSERNRPSSAPQPPAGMGLSSAEVDAWLSELDSDPLEIQSGRVNGRLYKGENLRALTVSSEIVLLEQKSTKPSTREDVIESHGNPRRTVATTWGEFLDYRSFGFDIRDGRVVTIVFFDNARY